MYISETCIGSQICISLQYKPSLSFLGTVSGKLLADKISLSGYWILYPRDRQVSACTYPLYPFAQQHKNRAGRDSIKADCYLCECSQFHLLLTQCLSKSRLFQTVFNYETTHKWCTLFHRTEDEMDKVAALHKIVEMCLDRVSCRQLHLGQHLGAALE